MDHLVIAVKLNRPSNTVISLTEKARVPNSLVILYYCLIFIQQAYIDRITKQMCFCFKKILVIILKMPPYRIKLQCIIEYMHAVNQLLSHHRIKNRVL